jgi:hypothetical protein
MPLVERLQMRMAVMALGALFMLAAGPAFAQSEESPWCTALDPFTKYCAYASQPDCMAAAKDVGAPCVRNPRYQAPPASAQAKPRRPQR